jgi:hypothetical protein
MLWLEVRVQQKTHDRRQPWVLVEITASDSTKSRGWAADYDDQQNPDNLSNNG